MGCPRSRSWISNNQSLAITDIWFDKANAGPFSSGDGGETGKGAGPGLPESSTCLFPKWRGPPAAFSQPVPRDKISKMKKKFNYISLLSRMGGTFSKVRKRFRSIGESITHNGTSFTLILIGQAIFFVYIPSCKFNHHNKVETGSLKVPLIGYYFSGSETGTNHSRFSNGATGFRRPHEKRPRCPLTHINEIIKNSL